MSRKIARSPMPWPEFHNTPPPQVADQLPKIRSDRWQRMEAGLFLMGITGWSITQELTEKLSRKFSGPRAPISGSTHYLFRDYLRYTGLIQYASLPYFYTGLAVARMTELGEEVCRAYGWMVKESEWGRLIRLHEGEAQPAHTAMILAFAREARQRNFKVTLAPEVQGNAAPDVYIRSKYSNARYFVEVEGRFHYPRYEKWHNLVVLQGCVAVVTMKPQSRRTIIEEIKALGITRGFAADLHTLRQNRKNHKNNPGWIWIEEWGRRPQNGRLPQP